jgi:hypothetical protein
MKSLVYFFLSGIIFFFLNCSSVENINKNNFLDSDKNRNLFLELQRKVECIGCNPTKEELLEYYNWPNTYYSYNKNQIGEILKKQPPKDFICNTGDQEWYCKQPMKSNHPPPPRSAIDPFKLRR